MGPEATFELKLTRKVKNLKGICLKFKSVESGWPDRVIVMPKGKTYWVELKRPDGKGEISALQRYNGNRLWDMGHEMHFIETELELYSFLLILEEDQDDDL